MKRLSAFLIDHRHIISAAMLVLAVLCGVLALRVPINRDRTKYLADKSNMKHGLSIMESDFPEAEEQSSIRVMFDGLADEQIPAVKSRLEAIGNVSSVEYEAGSEDYNKGSHTLFVVNSKYSYADEEEKAIEAAIGALSSEFTVAYQNNDIPATDVPPWVLLFALALALLILLAMSHSWLDPVLFLITIGFAVVINFGTNVFLPYIDSMTATVGPVLQLVLSMDYSIILMNRYRQEKGTRGNKLNAMKAALAGSIPSIASSSLTTAAGLLALLFLSFKLGPELGIVLAKGVFISMLCVFTILPEMILTLDTALEKARKKAPHIPMGLLSRFSYQARYAMPFVFAVLLAGSFLLQRSTTVTFADNGDDPLAGVFPKENTVVVVYASGDEGAIPGMIDELAKDGRISSVLGYSNTLGREMDAGEMCDAIRALGDDTRIDEGILRMLYFTAAGGELPALTASEFLTFLTDTVLPNETLSDYMDNRIRGNAEYLRKFSRKEALTAPMTAEETAEFFGIGEESAGQLFLYHAIQTGVPDSGTMTLPAFVDFVLDAAAENEAYGALFDDASLASLRQMRSFTDKGTISSPRGAAELSSLLGMEENTVKAVFKLYNAGDLAGRRMTAAEFSAFLCGNVMQDAVFSPWFDDGTKAQARALDSLIRLAGSGQGLTPGQTAQALGMEEGSIAGLYAMYFAEDPAFQTEAAAMTMPLTDFTALMRANASGEQAEQLSALGQLMDLAASGRQLDAPSMAEALGISAAEAAAVYMLNSAETMRLPDFLAAAVPLAPDNAELAQLNDILQLALSGEALGAPALAQALGLDVMQAYQLFGLSLAARKTVPLADFTGFLVSSVLSAEAYAASFSPAQAAQLRQLSGILQLAASGEALDAPALAQAFGMEEELAGAVFRLYYGADITGTAMSLREFTDFLLSDPLMGARMNKASLKELRSLQSIMNSAAADTAFTSAGLAAFLGMDPAQAEQLYILHMYETGLGDGWVLSPRDFVSFAVTEVLGNEGLAQKLDDASAEALKRGHALIEAVVSGKAYTADEMSRLLASLTEDISAKEAEILYLYYGGIHSSDRELKMTIPRLFRFLSGELLSDERFAGLIDAETKAEILDKETELDDAVRQMKGDRYSRLILTSDYPDEAPETEDYILRLRKLCDGALGEYYLIGNSVMAEELEETFDWEYLLITLITAVAVFLVVLAAFRSPTLPLILTILVQCGVFITVTVIGAYTGSIYYLALLIVQSILMGATIDYGIVFCNFYRENRKALPVTDALKAAYESSIHTIMTSGSILVLVLAILGVSVSSGMITEVSITLSIGALIAILLILLVLPALVACCDRLIFRAGKDRPR